MSRTKWLPSKKMFLLDMECIYLCLYLLQKYQQGIWYNLKIVLMKMFQQGIEYIHEHIEKNKYLLGMKSKPPHFLLRMYLLDTYDT